MLEAKVAILMGSQSDRLVMESCLPYLEFFGIRFEVFILSAHRNPIETAAFATNAEKNGFKIIIAGAGMAAHLPGVIAAYTSLPVIGVPLEGSALNGVDALYSIVQMPSGIPVATMSIGRAGAINAGIFAAKILALENESIKQKFVEFKALSYRVKQS